MVSRIGICLILAGLFIGIFKGISGFMEARNYWVDLTISKIIGESRSEAVIELLDAAVYQNTMDYMVYELPFFLFVLGLGVLFLIVSMFVKEH